MIDMTASTYRRQAESLPRLPVYFCLFLLLIALFAGTAWSKAWPPITSQNDKIIAQPNINFVSEKAAETLCQIFLSPEMNGSGDAGASRRDFGKAATIGLVLGARYAAQPRSDFVQPSRAEQIAAWRRCMNEAQITFLQEYRQSSLPGSL